MKINSDLAQILNLPPNSIEAKLEFGFDRAPVITVSYYLFDITPEMLEKINEFVMKDKEQL